VLSRNARGSHVRLNWTWPGFVKQAERDAGLRSDGLTTAEREELRRENRILREEREILKQPREIWRFLGYYAWRSRPPSRRQRENVELLERVRGIWEASGRVYGAPRVHAELRAGGVRCSRKPLSAADAAWGMAGAYRRRRKKGLTRQGQGALPAPDLGRRQFRVLGPTGCGWPYLGVVLDVWSRRVVGWAMRPDARAELVVDALGMALWRRKPAPGLVHHSDRGSQYTSLRSWGSPAASGDFGVYGAPGGCIRQRPVRGLLRHLEVRRS